MLRNAAALSVTDVISRVRRLSAVRRSARSSACRRFRSWGSGASRARRAGFGLWRLLNVEAQSCVGASQRLLDGLRRVGAGEDEAEVLPALGQWNHLLP